MFWVGLSAGTACAALGLARLGLPSASLFGALVAGLVAALAWPRRPPLPAAVFAPAHAVTGVTLGAYLEASSLSVIADAWLPVTLVTLATLALSLASGILLARITGIGAATASLGMVAGGSSGILAMSRELGADDRLVAFMQYLRVLLVVLLVPLIVAVAGPGDGGSTPSRLGAPLLGEPTDALMTLAIAPAGALLGRLAGVPGGRLLGPMVLAGAVTLAIPDAAFDVPPLLRETAFAIIGLQVGLRFTAATLRHAGRLAVPVLAIIVALLIACFGLAAGIALTTGVALLDAYLATTPGGLFAVAAAALGAGADATFVIAVQTLRLLATVMLAPFIVRRLVASQAAVRTHPD